MYNKFQNFFHPFNWQCSSIEFIRIHFSLLNSKFSFIVILLQHEITPSIRHRHPNYPVIGVNTIESECKCRCSRPFFNVLDSTASVANVSGCLYPCHSPEQSLKDQRFLTAWITTWFDNLYLSFSPKLQHSVGDDNY